MNAHTPAPWIIKPARSYTHPLYVNGPRRVVCDVVSGSGVQGEADDEGKANAALIAAAPELLRCLKEAVASWELADEEAEEPGDGDALAEWKAAIAKAEGRS